MLGMVGLSTGHLANMRSGGGCLLRLKVFRPGHISVASLTTDLLIPKAGSCPLRGDRPLSGQRVRFSLASNP